jgi:DNA invertase Pin-like site-specific DNA recombinase
MSGRAMTGQAATAVTVFLASSKSMVVPSALTALLGYVREGDTVVVWKLDRLGRNTLHVLETVKALTDRGVALISTTDGIDSSTAAGRMVIAVLASMAEFERELTKPGSTDSVEV